MTELYQADIWLCATVYIKAQNDAAAADKVRGFTDSEFHLQPGGLVSDRRLTDPELPTISISPAVTTYGLASALSKIDDVLQATPEILIVSAPPTAMPQADTLGAFVRRIAAMTAPDLESLSNDQAFENAGDLAGLIADAHEISKAAPAKPWLGWIATYGEDGLEIQFFRGREFFEKSVSDVKRDYDAGNLLAFKYGAAP